MDVRKKSADLKSSKKLFFNPYKREVTADRGVIVANHPLASCAGIEMLARGGNAFDASIAALFALTVVEPMMVSIFGAGFFVIRDGQTGKITTIDNYAVAPKAATEDLYTPVEKRQLGQYLFETVGRENMVGHLSVATPGTLKAWEHVIKNFGALSLHQVMEPAIKYAYKGYRASPYLVYCIEQAHRDLDRYPTTSMTFLPNGKPLKPGDEVIMTDYGDTLSKIASKGSDVLYRGEIAKRVVEDMEENKGILSHEDLADYSLIKRSPVSGKYRDRFEVYSMAPTSSGGTHIIQMLNILENFDLSTLGYGTTEHLHLFTEVLKIAFADRQRYMGDPERVDVPVNGLTSKSYSKKRAEQISLDTARTYPPGEPAFYAGEEKNTTHVSAIDLGGNIVSATQTLFSSFGSRVMVPGTGMLLNNCMGLFDPRPGQANSVSGGKRMLSSMSPTIVLRDGKPFLCLGSPGGTRIFAAVCQAIINIVDFGMSLQEAIEAPRIWTMGIAGTPGEKLHIETGFPEKTQEGLKARGHEVIIVPKVAGGTNGILFNDTTGLMHGGACWRADGAPMGFSGGYAHPKALIPPPQV